MKISIIGAGNVGKALGFRWAELGHQITFGVRDPEAAKVRVLVEEAPVGTAATGLEEAAERGELVVLTVPWGAAREAVEACGDLGGKVLVDCTNPLAPNLSGLELGHTTSAAEQIAKWAPHARVVKAFNTTGSSNMEDTAFGAQKIVMPVCGADAEAKRTVLGLAAELGFEAVDAGPLANARLLEPMAMLWIHLAYAQGFGRDFGFALARR